MKTVIAKSAAILTAVGLLALSAGAAQQAPQVPQADVLRNLPAGLTAAQVQAHQIAPAHIKGIQIEEVDPAREVHLRIPPRTKPPAKSPHLDVDAFGKAAHAALKDEVDGYMLQVRQHGKLVYNLIWNWARRPGDGSAGWNENTRLHLASVSKYLTAVGLVKTLDAHGISYDAKIVDYLPTYWKKGPNVDKITFRNLMTHRSGFKTGGSGSDFALMKSKVEAGVMNPGQPSGYENMNYGICRILISIINAPSIKNLPGTPGSDIGDRIWDAMTIHQYRKYMQDNVFTPAGVALADFSRVPGIPSALGYQFPGGDGWDSGDLASVSGGAGWRLSIKEVLNVMDHVRRKGDILSSQKAQYMLDNYFGIDENVDTPAGKIYDKAGRWGTGDNHTEQCVAYFLPDDIEVAVFVNSPIGVPDYSLRKLVKDLYLNSLN